MKTNKVRGDQSSKNFGREFSKISIFSYDFEWKNRKFFDLKNFENFHSKMYEKWDRKKSKIFDLIQIPIKIFEKIENFPI